MRIDPVIISDSRPEGGTDAAASPRLTIVMLVAILAVAAALRLVALGVIPAGLSHDEAVKGYDGWSIIHTGRDQYGERFPLIFRAIGDYREAIMPYLIAFSIAVLGPTDFAVRLPAALAGVALVAGVYLLGRELFDQWAGLLAAAFLAISPWHVQVSRLAFRAGLTPVCITFGLWLFIRAVRRGRSLVPGAVVLALSLHTYLAARAFLPLLLLGLVAVYRSALLARPRAAAWAAVAMVVVALPLLLWGARHPADFIGHAGESAGLEEAGGAAAYLFDAGRKYAAYFGPDNLLLQGDPYPVPSTGRSGVLHWPQAPLLLVGLAILLRRRRPADQLALWWLAVYPLAPAFTDGTPPDWLRSTTGLPLFELITAVGAVATWRWLSARRTADGDRWWSRPWLPAALFGALLLANGAWFLHDYTMRFPDRAAWAFHDGVAEAVRLLAEREAGYQTVVLTNTVPAIHDFYLFYSRYDPHRLQREGLDDRAPPGAWADVRGFGKYRVCDPRLCCRTGSLCLVEGHDRALPEPLARIADRTGRIAFTIVVGTD